MMDVWDTAGQEEYMALTRTFFQGAHCVIITFAVDSPKTFNSVQTHLDNINQNCDEDVLKVLVGNKCDLEDRYISFDDINLKADDLGIRFFETSAMPDKKETIEELFAEIAVALCDKKMQPRNQSIRL